MKKFVCVHGHFYQPPRENPWLEEVEVQDSAFPNHDWNEKICHECYQPNSASRLVNERNEVIDIVNNYDKMSYNFGPTLFSWMRKKQPETYQAIIKSKEGAIAQCYNHMIMPLANERDKHTQVIWAIKDFSFHYKNFPSGMWLPETAVDVSTLEHLAENGIQFTILAPHQAKRIKKIGDKEWQTPFENFFLQNPFLCRLPSGKTIALFFYDGGVAFEISFRDLLANGEKLGKRLGDMPKENTLESIATDGETFGHHKKFGDMALASCFNYLQKHNFTLTNFTAYLKDHPPLYEVEIEENTSWSCAHGIGRWKQDCSCNAGRFPNGNQKWREPLRAALDFLRDTLAPLFEREMAPLLLNPWKARDDYIDVVLNTSPEAQENFFQKNGKKELSLEDKRQILRHMEMQRHAMLMYTSCGWFFDDISGIETVQILCYAMRVFQLLNSPFLEKQFLDILEKAKSNVPEFENGKRIFELFVTPSVVNLEHVGAHYALSILFKDYPETSDLFCYKIERSFFARKESGLFRHAVGNIKITSTITLEEQSFYFLAISSEGYFLRAHLIEELDEKTKVLYQSLESAFEMKRYDKIYQIIQLLDKGHTHTLWDLFADERKQILGILLKIAEDELDTSLRITIEKNFSLIQNLKEHDATLPDLLQKSLESYFSEQLLAFLEKEEINIVLIDKAIRWKINLNTPIIKLAAEQMMLKLLEKWKENPFDMHLMKKIRLDLDVFADLKLDIDLWQLQNACVFLKKAYFHDMLLKQDSASMEWLELFSDIAQFLHIRL